MKQKTLIYMVIKPSIVLAAAVLTAASLLAPSTAVAEDPTYLMPTGPGGGQPDDGKQPFDPNPAAPGSKTRQFLTYGVDSDNNPVPRKTLRITNNTAHTVYPIMRDPNSATIDKTSTHPVGLYDPYDDANKEYRGYIGYKEGKGRPQILLRPETRRKHPREHSAGLLEWRPHRHRDRWPIPDAEPKDPNPLRYRPTARRSIANAETSADTIPNGVVMWYRADTAEAPNDDTEDQLAEWTIRDHGYLVNPKITEKTNSKIPDNQLVTLINYDVSNVDNLYLPLAMEATDVWVVPQKSGTGPNANRTGWGPGSNPDVYGWTGAINKIDFLQTAIREFTADNNQLLGQYFGGKGWPFYNIPNPTNDPKAPLKIPSGANVFAQSPIKAVPSSYGDGKWQNDKYMLSSGGTQPISATIGWAGGTPDRPASTILHLNLAELSAKIHLSEKGYLVTGRPPDNSPNPQSHSRLAPRSSRSSTRGGDGRP